MGKYTEDVERGAALLTEKLGPGWESRIDISTLDIMDPDDCILGQVFRQDARILRASGYGYAFGLYPFSDSALGEYVYNHQHFYGFCGSDPYLREEWVAYLKSRVPASV